MECNTCLFSLKARRQSLIYMYEKCLSLFNWLLIIVKAKGGIYRSQNKRRKNILARSWLFSGRQVVVREYVAEKTIQSIKIARLQKNKGAVTRPLCKRH